MATKARRCERRFWKGSEVRRLLPILPILALLSLPAAAQAKPKPCHARHVRKHGRCVKVKATVKVKPSARVASPAPSSAPAAPAAVVPVVPPATSAPSAAQPIQTFVSWTGLLPPCRDDRCADGRVPIEAPCESFTNRKPGTGLPPRGTEPTGCFLAHVEASTTARVGEYEWTLYQKCQPIFVNDITALSRFGMESWDWDFYYRSPQPHPDPTVSPPVPPPDCEGATVLYSARSTGSLDLQVGQEFFLNTFERPQPGSIQQEEEDEENVAIWSVGTKHLRLHPHLNITGPRNDEPLILRVNYVTSTPTTPAWVYLNPYH